VFLRKLKDKKEKEKESWDAVWVDAEELMDEGLLVGMGMGRDHMLGTTVAALDGARVMVMERAQRAPSPELFCDGDGDGASAAPSPELHHQSSSS
jgi:hypothetical protein